MFALNEDEIAAVQAAWDASGELAAAVELRRLFPGIADLQKARECARTVAGWRRPVPVASERTERGRDAPEHVARSPEAALDRTGTVVPFGRRRKVSRPG